MRQAIPPGDILGFNVEKFRKQEGLTQRDLAKIIGVSPSNIRDIEIGKGNSCSAQTLVSLKEFFGVHAMQREKLTHMTRTHRLLQFGIDSLTEEELMPIVAIIADIRDREASNGHFQG